MPCELLPVLPSSQQTSVTDTREVAGLLQSAHTPHRSSLPVLLAQQVSEHVDEAHPAKGVGHV